MTFYSRAHYKRVSPRSDTPRDIRLRLLNKQAMAAAEADTDARYPTLTVENAAELLRYREDRFKFYQRQLGITEPAQ